ncbi:MAG: hypothetical protein OQK11_08825 [Thiovulaceae bacterium]|nr:hypothetical protein [Sulfurimonadaceae bacterium]
MKKITISTIILGMALYGSMFEHSTDVKANYWFDSDQQNENKKLAAELAKFQNGTATEEEINYYIKQRDEDKEIKPFADGIYVDAEIVKEREANIVTEKIYEKESCGWFFSLFGCDEEKPKQEDNNSTQMSAEDVTEANEAAQKAVEKLDSELKDVKNENIVEEKGAFQDNIDSEEPAIEEEKVQAEPVNEGIEEQTQNVENPTEGAEQ